MAPSRGETESATLREITDCFASTPKELLPGIASRLAKQLLSCRPIFRSDDILSKSQVDADARAALHRFRTRLSTFLQDKSPERRWAAIVLIKTTVELGGREVLASALPWVNGLRTILSKPDPCATKKLCIITLTRIFLLTHGYPALLREITTPSLPDYINRCLTILESKSTSVKRSLAQPILESFAELLPHHPATFRPSVGVIRSPVLLIISETPSSNSSAATSTWKPFMPSKSCRMMAYRVFTLLPFCIPKTATQEWEDAFSRTVKAAHLTSDRLFRAVLEDFYSSHHEILPTNAGQAAEYETQLLADDFLGLPSWKGVQAGSERLAAILGILEQFVLTRTHLPINLKTGQCLDLLSRILRIVPPARGDHGSSEPSLPYNPNISKAERTMLFSKLPSIHIAALDLISALLQRLQHLILPSVEILLDLLSWVFGAESFSSDLRLAMYRVTAQLVGLFGSALPSSLMPHLEGILKSCCTDLLRDDLRRVPVAAPSATVIAGSSGSSRATDRSAARQSEAEALTPGINDAALNLVRASLARLDHSSTERSTRALLDRTAILCRDRDALVAAVLNPPGRSGNSSAAMYSSPMPMLARLYPSDLPVDAILRPRMPLRPVVVEAERDPYSETDHLNEASDLDSEDMSLEPMVNRLEPLPSEMQWEPPEQEVIASTATELESLPRALPRLEHPRDEGHADGGGESQGLTLSKRRRLDDTEPRRLETTEELQVPENKSLRPDNVTQPTELATESVDATSALIPDNAEGKAEEDGDDDSDFEVSQLKFRGDTDTEDDDDDEEEAEDEAEG